MSSCKYIHEGIIPMVNYKHLTHEQRVLTEDRLNHKISIRSISKKLGKPPPTILREIQNHSTYIETTRNNYANRHDCTYKHVCGVICSK